MKPSNENTLAAIDPVCGLQIDSGTKSKYYMSVKNLIIPFYLRSHMN